MNIDQQLVRQIVARVLDQIGTTPATLRDEPAMPVETTAATTGALVIDDKVVTGDLLEARLHGRQRVAFANGSILTPSAKDVLRRCGTEWNRIDLRKTSETGLAWKAIVLRSVPALDAAIDDVSGWSRELTGSEREAVDSGISSICRADATGVCLFSASPERTACRCNRNERVRAAVVADIGGVRRIQSDLGANVYCVNPEGRSYFQLRNMLRAVSSVSPQASKEWT
ncbi:MAG: hypothetical protein O3A00_01000 [Planctomycetota bacterium]|nr:hypothetical protein [Planctomycetota bacterium]